MRISIREALFSGEEVETWEPPKSVEDNFIFDLYDSADNSKWNKEVIKTIPDLELSSGFSYVRNKNGWNRHWGYLRPDIITLRGALDGLSTETPGQAIWHIPTRTLLFTEDAKHNQLIRDRDVALLSAVDKSLNNNRYQEIEIPYEL